ncbi:MAG: DUF1254 domain-containing protein [Pseudomonadales bacterium]|nr:DUF1254 domain-containing protein [Pseudomonadales bacterium]
MFSHPEVSDQFFTFELVDLWMIVKDSVGTNTSGEQAMTYLFTGPDWQGTVPEGMTHISFPTRYMIILGRTYALNTPEDLAKVHALQAQYQVRPLSAWGKPYTFEAPPVDPKPGFSMTEAPQAADTRTWYRRLLQPDDPPHGGPAPAPGGRPPCWSAWPSSGIAAGQPFDSSQLAPEIQAALGRRCHRSPCSAW